MEANNEFSGVVQIGEENLKAAEKRLGTDIAIGALMETATVAGLWVTAQGARAVEAGNEVNKLALTMGVEVLNMVNQMSPAAFEVLNQGRELAVDFLSTNPHALVDVALVGAGAVVTGWVLEQVGHDIDVRDRAEARLERTKRDIADLSRRMSEGVPGWFAQRNQENVELKQASEQVAVGQMLAMKEENVTDSGTAGGGTTGRFPVKDFTNSRY